MASAHIQWLDILVIVVYFGGITWAGIYFGKRNKSTEDYFLGNRSFPGWVIGLSMVGTSISSMTFIAYPADAYKTAYLRLLPAFMLPVGVLIASYVFLPFFRRGGLTSAYEYLEERFGPGTRLYAATAFIIGQVFRLGMILYLLAVLVEQLTGLPTGWAIVIAGVFVSFYTIAGGIEAVVWTDVVQTVVLVVGGVLCLGYIIIALDEGIGQIISTAMADGKFRFAHATVLPDGTHVFEETRWTISLWQKTGTMMLFIGLTNWLFEYSGNQNVIQRYAASKSAHEARKAMWICAASSVPIWTFFMFLGTALYVFFKHHPDPNAFAMLADPNVKAEGILPYFVIKFLPPGFSGLVVSAAIAAAMSSLDSSINAISTVSVVDLYRRHLRPGRDDTHYLRVARVVATLASVLMILFAFGFAQYGGETLQDTGTIITALTGAGLLGLFMLGFFTKVGDGRAVACGIAATLVWTAWMTIKHFGYFPEAFPTIDEYYVGILGNFIMFGLGFGAGLLLPKRERDLTNLTIWTQDGKPLD